MPRKTKDEKIEEVKMKETKRKSKVATTKKVASKKIGSEKNTSKKTATQKATTEKKPSKKATTKKAVTEKTVATPKKVVTKKAVSSKKEPNKKTTKVTTTKDSKIEKATKVPKSTTKPSKKTTIKKEAEKVTVAKPKKATSKAKTSKSAKTAAKVKESTKKTTTKKKSTKTTTSTNISLGEYYDLPNQYERTLVKILAQTPTILFVYWDISAKDRQNLLNQYGENFFFETSPFLRIKNLTKSYEYEVEINDYANSWYLHIPDSDCEYEVILMRKNRNSQAIKYDNGQMTIISSNQLETPNDHILFERLGKNIFFQDVKTHKTQSKNIADFAFIQKIGRIYNIYDLYKEIYQNELNGDELGMGLSSSNFSSNFK